ncbi:serine hydrolase domain-containing protein [Nonomuraea dietziae]|uniref:serine hydrolase domain-containing protein n=1 Tax=Nonomuraea dietziae TaxID=65515 RepID=UPI0031D54859
MYSNTNYLILGLLLEKVTGTTAKAYITEHVIRRAGLRHTTLPTGPRIKGPHPRMYEAMHGRIDPPRDYSVYDPSWVGVGAALVVDRGGISTASTARCSTAGSSPGRRWRRCSARSRSPPRSTKTRSTTGWGCTRSRSRAAAPSGATTGTMWGGRGGGP